MVLSRCCVLKKWPPHRMTAPGSGVKPPAFVMSHGAQRMLDGGTSHPESFKCFIMKTNRGPDVSLVHSRALKEENTYLNS